MARYVLLSFDNTETANEFVKRIDRQTEQGKPFRVIGIYARFTKFCECGDDVPATEIKMDKKTRWWYHARCKKPRKRYQCPANLRLPQTRHDLSNDINVHVADDPNKELMITMTSAYLVKHEEK